MTALEFLEHLTRTRDRRLLEAVGSDNAYLESLKKKDCCHCGRSPWGEYLTIPAHVRSVAHGSGTSIKPPYNAVPLCHWCHQAQHITGENAVGGRAELQQQADHNLLCWVFASLAKKFGHPEWRLLLPWWMEENGIYPLDQREVA